jgi:hypothetical protein
MSEPTLHEVNEPFSAVSTKTVGSVDGEWVTLYVSPEPGYYGPTLSREAQRLEISMTRFDAKRLVDQLVDELMKGAK